MKELLEQYQTIVPSIFKKFGIDNGNGEIDIQIDRPWNHTGLTRGESVYWTDDHGELYGNEILHTPRSFENYLLFFVDNGCGDSFYMIFDANLRDSSLANEY